MDFFRSRFMNKSSGTANRTCGTDHVVEHQAYLTLDGPTDNVLLLSLEGVVSDFIDNR
jgi:hypothetical protein